MDFASAHPYIRESWSNFTLEETMALMKVWADESHNIIKKPLYIGEFNVELQERYEWWEEMYGFIEENKIGASGFWWFPDNKTPRDKFGVFEGDVEVAIYKEHALRMEQMSGGEAIYLSLMSPKSGDKFVSGSEVHIEANLLNENNTVAKVEFFSNGVLVGEDVFAPYEFDLSGLADGNYSITSIATGIDGTTKESTPRNIQIGGEGILTLEYKDASTSVTSNVIKPHFRLFNNSSQDVPYSDITVRYWFETEEDLPLNFTTDYAVIGNNNVKGKFVNVKLISGIEPGTTVDTPTALIVASTTSGNGPLSVAFDASGSTDPNGDTLTYAWDFGNGATATGATATYEFIEFGEQLVTLTVNDGNGNSDTDTIAITVTDPNVAPVASFTSTAESGIAPVSITFDASTSSDENNDPLTYAWDFGNGDTAIGITTTYAFTTTGEFAVKLTVSDGSLDSSITKTITVTNGDLVASFTADQTSGVIL